MPSEYVSRIAELELEVQALERARNKNAFNEAQREVYNKRIRTLKTMIRQLQKAEGLTKG